jgi:tetratricopeptide (TPR) repeat protein
LPAPGRVRRLEAAFETWKVRAMSPSLRTLLILASSVTLAACAGVPTASGPVALAPARGDTSVYGLFLAGQAAIQSGDSKAAADYFARAQAADPTEVSIRDRAYTAALLAGEYDKAAALAPGVDKDNLQLQALIALSRGVELLATNRPADAYASLASAPPQAQTSSAAALLAPWAAGAAGKWDAALVSPDSKDRVFRLIGAMNQALLFERARRYEEAETAFKAAQADKAGRPIIGPAFAGFLERRGRAKDAVAVYDELIAAYPDDEALAASRARAASGGKAPPAPTFKEGAAQALLAPAAALVSDRQNQSALVYLRFVLRLDPKREDALMLVADLLSQSGDKAAARAAYAKVPASSPRYVNARSRLAWSYQDDDKAMALKLTQETLAARPGDADAQLAVADMLRVNARYDESVAILDKMIAEAGARVSWRLHYMRGAAYERGGHWAEAEKDLQRALSLKPDEPELLNYLGYAWVSRGENVKQAMAMIQKAVDQQPDNGAYIDSLGWAYYQLGDYKSAIVKLERAAELEAGDAEVNDHLGDAYWKLGRKDEARFKWRAVLTLDPDPEIKTRVDAKLASPLGPDAVGPSRALARQ